MSLPKENCDNQTQSKTPGESDDDFNPYSEAEQQEMEWQAGTGWLVDENELFQFVLASPESNYNKRWTKAYEEKLNRDGKSDEKIRFLKEMDIYGAVHSRMLKVWIGTENRTAKKHYCWVFPAFGENSLRRTLMGYDKKRTEALAQFQQDAGIDPSESPGAWVYVDHSYQQAITWQERKED